MCQGVSAQIHTVPPGHNLADMLSLSTKEQGDTLESLSVTQSVCVSVLAFAHSEG